MKTERIREIANAVLYEGYLLYPYRHSAIKNRQRWTIGVVYPRAYGEAAGPTEPWRMHTQCLALGGANTTLDMTVRFLHLLVRTAAPDGQPSTTPHGALDWAPDFWEEGVECEVEAHGLALAQLVEQPRRIPFTFPDALLVDDGPGIGGQVVCKQRALAGAFTVTAEAVSLGEPGQSSQDAYRIGVCIENTTSLDIVIGTRHADVLPRSLVSTHTILGVHDGAFVSQLDPPASLRAAAGACRHDGAWPVLVGDEGDRDAMLFSPIILYDYPQLAPESAGPLFDGTEIDEILTLRILTLTDEEKAEMRQGDERAREILDRTESLSGEQFMKLHGAIRGLGPSQEGGEP